MSKHTAIIDYTDLQRVARAVCRRLPQWACVDAEDLAQESALAALRGRKSRKGPMQDTLRKQGWMKQHRSGGETVRVVLDERTYGHSPENRLVAQIDTELLLSRLTPYQRQAVALHHLAGMTETEMSKSLSIPIQRVKNRIHNGLKNMRSRAQRGKLDETI
jgi:DNA-directed RNA polymerase specialized sigma24 family protein